MNSYDNYYKIDDIRKILDERVAYYESKYGKSDKTIETFYCTHVNSDDYIDIINECRIYVQARQLIFITKENLYVIPFSKIIGYDIIDVNRGSTPIKTATTTITKTDTGDLIKRAIIGGVVAGDMGALIGASTAKKTTTSNQSTVDSFLEAYDKYVFSANLQLLIKVDDVINPTISIMFHEFKQEAEGLAASLDVIIKQNTEIVISDDSIIVSEPSNIESTGIKLGIRPSNPYRERNKQLEKIRREKEEQSEKMLYFSIGIIGAFLFIALIIYLIINN